MHSLPPDPGYQTTPGIKKKESREKIQKKLSKKHHKAVTLITCSTF